MFLLACIGNTYAGVNNDGSYGYSVPITAPAGRAGLDLKLSLNYNSNRGTGLAGKGWSLDGIQVGELDIAKYDIDHLKFARVIDTGKVIIPKPKVLDELPDEYHITGRLLDRSDGKPLLFISVIVKVDGKEIAKADTDKEGNIYIVLYRNDLTFSNVQKILKGDIDFSIYLWGKELTKFAFRDSFPKPVIDLIEKNGFNIERGRRNHQLYDSGIMLAYDRLLQSKADKNLNDVYTSSNADNDGLIGLLAADSSDGKSAKVATFRLGDRKLYFPGQAIFLRINMFAKDTNRNEMLNDWKGCMFYPDAKYECGNPRKTIYLQHNIPWKVCVSLFQEYGGADFDLKFGFEHKHYKNSDYSKIMTIRKSEVPSAGWQNKKGNKDENGNYATYSVTGEFTDKLENVEIYPTEKILPNGRTYANNPDAAFAIEFAEQNHAAYEPGWGAQSAVKGKIKTSSGIKDFNDILIQRRSSVKTLKKKFPKQKFAKDIPSHMKVADLTAPELILVFKFCTPQMKCEVIKQLNIGGGPGFFEDYISKVTGMIGKSKPIYSKYNKKYAISLDAKKIPIPSQANLGHSVMTLEITKLKEYGVMPESSRRYTLGLILRVI